MGVLAFRIVSIWGITLLIDELVQRTTTSGFADLSAPAASPDTLTPSRFVRPTTSPRSRDTRELGHHLITSGEFREKNPDFAHTNDRTIVIKEIDGADGHGASVRLFVDLSDHVIGLNIVRGHYERDEIAFVRRLLRP